MGSRQRSDGDLVRSVAILIEKQGDFVVSMRKALEEQDEFTMAGLKMANEEMVKMARNDNVKGTLRQSGLFPYLADPDSRIQQEIQSVMENLGATREEAVRYILSQVRVPST